MSLSLSNLPLVSHRIFVEVYESVSMKKFSYSRFVLNPLSELNQSVFGLLVAKILNKNLLNYFDNA